MDARLMGKLCFFPGVVAEEALRQRVENQEGVKLLLGEIAALMEALRGLAVGTWPNARKYLLDELELRHLALAELLGVG